MVGSVFYVLVLDFHLIKRQFSVLSYLSDGSNTFTKVDFKIAAERLVNAEHGYYTFKDLYLELGNNNADAGKKNISALIGKNFFNDSLSDWSLTTNSITLRAGVPVAVTTL